MNKPYTHSTYILSTPHPSQKHSHAHTKHPSAHTHTHNHKHTATCSMLEVQVVRPVEQVDHDKGEGEGDSGVVVYVVGVLHVAAVYGAQDLADEGQGAQAAVGGVLGGGLGLGLAAGGARGSPHRLGGHGHGGRSGGLLAPLGPVVGVVGDGGYDAVHLLVKVTHRMAVLEDKEKEAG